MLTDVVIANKSYIKINIKKEDGLDRTALQVMRRDCPGFLLPVREMEIDGETELRYELSEGVRLAYMAREMTRKGL